MDPGPMDLDDPGTDPDDDLSELFADEVKQSHTRPQQESLSQLQSQSNPSGSTGPTGKRGRGRPKGSFGSKFLRECLAKAAPQPLQQHLVPESDADDAAAAHAARAAYAREVLAAKRMSRNSATASTTVVQQSSTLSAYGDSISTKTVGSDLQQHIVTALQCATQSGICGDDDKLVDHALNGGMQTMSFKAFTAMTDEMNINRRLLAIARAVLEASCYLWSLFLMLLINMCIKSQHQLKPILCCLRLRYDETPTRVRVDDVQEEQVEGTDFNEQTSTAATHAKILQVEFACTLLLEDTCNQTYTMFCGQIPTSLFALKSTNGRTTSQALLRVLKSCTGLEDIGRQCKYQIRHSCSDQAKSNYTAERFVSGEFPEWLSFHTPCDIHRLYRSTRTSMRGLDYDVSGLISFALALGDPGSAAVLRNKLGQIIARRLAARLIENSHPTESSY